MLGQVYLSGVLYRFTHNCPKSPHPPSAFLTIWRGRGCLLWCVSKKPLFLNDPYIFYKIDKRGASGFNLDPSSFTPHMQIACPHVFPQISAFYFSSLFAGGGGVGSPPIPFYSSSSILFVTEYLKSRKETEMDGGVPFPNLSFNKGFYQTFLIGKEEMLIKLSWALNGRQIYGTYFYTGAKPYISKFIVHVFTSLHQKI